MGCALAAKANGPETETEWHETETKTETGMFTAEISLIESSRPTTTRPTPRDSAKLAPSGLVMLICTRSVQAQLNVFGVQVQAHLNVFGVRVQAHMRVVEPVQA